MNEAVVIAWVKQITDAQCDECARSDAMCVARWIGEGATVDDLRAARDVNLELQMIAMGGFGPIGGPMIRPGADTPL